MANELVIHYPTGATLYALLFDATGQVYNGSAFAAPGSAAWTDYDIAMTEVATSTGIYRASMPAAAAGSYGWVVRKQAGAGPAVGDITVGSGTIAWSGTAEIVPLAPTVAGRTLDVSAGGEAGIDWANVGSPTTTVGLSATTIKASTDTETDIAALNDLDAAGVRAAVGLAAADLDTQLAGLPTDADVQTAAAAALTAYDPPTKAELDSGLAAIPTVGEIDTQLSTTHGDGSWEGIGTGATTQVYTVYLADGVTPVEGVVVRMTTDAAGLVLIDQQISDASGEVTLNHDLASGTTVYLWRYKVGLEYSDPDVEVIP